jgi:hypothetical protein
VFYFTLVPAKSPTRSRVRNSLSDDRLHLDLDQPLGIEEACDDDHRRCRVCVAERLCMCGTDVICILRVHDEHPGTDHIVHPTAKALDRLACDLGAPKHLSPGARLQFTTSGSDRRRASDMDDITNTYCSGEPVCGLVRRHAVESLSSHTITLAEAQGLSG